LTAHIRIVKKNDENDDIFYWLEKSPMERIIALEQIRAQHHALDDDSQRGFQRVLSIRKKSQD
jgi:hypothetical protein